MSECENSCVIHASNCKGILFKQLWICKQWIHSDTDLVTSFLSDLRRPRNFQMPCSIILQQSLSCPHRIHITYRMFSPIGANDKLSTLIFSLDTGATKSRPNYIIPHIPAHDFANWRGWKHLACCRFFGGHMPTMNF